MKRIALCCLLASSLGCSVAPAGAADEQPPASGPTGTDLSLGAPAIALEPDGVPAEACPLGPAPSDDAVATTAGWVTGARRGGVRSFKGIPFAAPPVGERRLKPPAPAGCFEEPLEAVEMGPACIQPEIISLPFGGQQQSEDCLRLNVWTPEEETGAPLPVMVFIHGGANILGSASDFIPYDGEPWAREHGVVFVTLQYRLGPLGFLAHPALAAESERGASGNYAQLDQIKALEWVRDNIAAFGGDPEQVMLFGESAGALNTCLLLASPLAAGLFDAALIQSGDCSILPREDAEQRGTLEAAELGCAGEDDVASCLRELPAERFAEMELDPTALGGPRGWNDLPAVPNLDGWVFEDEPLALFERGEHNKVPVVVGSNAHEMELFLPPTLLTCGQYEALLGDLLGPLQGEVLARYPCLGYLTPRRAAVDASTDFMFTCPARRIARALSAGQQEPVWRYYYAYTRKDPQVAALRASHASELFLLFDSYDRLGYVPPLGERRLAEAMQASWASLAHAGSPDGEAAAWPLCDAAMDNALELDASLTATRLVEVEDIQGELCDWWDTLPR